MSFRYGDHDDYKVSLPVLHNLFAGHKFVDVIQSGLSTVAINKVNELASVKIKRLDLVNLNISSIPDFSRFKSLLHLDLSDNSLKKLTKNSFSDLSLLKILNLENCDIDDIESDTFAMLGALTDLNLCSNPICRTIEVSEFTTKHGLMRVNDFRFCSCICE